MRRVTQRDRRTASPRMALDDVSKAIIEQLQQDGRRPYATVAKAVGLSEAGGRQRGERAAASGGGRPEAAGRRGGHRLSAAGVMQIVAVTDPLTVGFRRQAMIGLRTEGD